MTWGQHRRLQKWERRVQPAYEAGVMDGMDCAFLGEPRPFEPSSELITTIYLRPYLRRAQAVSNAAVARMRGRYDGFELAAEQIRKADDEDFIDCQVAEGMAQIESYLRQKAA